MMEKTAAGYLPFQKKIIPYLDGTLSAEERAEFEAFVLTHPEFEGHIKTKEDEMNLLRSLIPAAMPGKETENSLDNEIRTSVYHLLKKEPANFWETMKNTWEDIVSR